MGIPGGWLVTSPLSLFPEKARQIVYTVINKVHIRNVLNKGK